MHMMYNEIVMKIYLWSLISAPRAESLSADTLDSLFCGVREKSPSESREYLSLPLHRPVIESKEDVISTVVVGQSKDQDPFSI